MKKVLFHLTEEQYAKLKVLARRMGVSKPEALRRAVEITMFIRDQCEEMRKRPARRKEGEKRVVEIIG